MSTPSTAALISDPRHRDQHLIEELAETFALEFAGPAHRRLTELYWRAQLQFSTSFLPTVGSPIPAPHHVLDYLATSRDLVAEELTLFATPFTVCSVPLKPRNCAKCDRARRFEAWPTAARAAMSMCERCVDLAPETFLGAGRATYLLAPNEVPAEVVDICDAVTAELGRESISSDLEVLEAYWAARP